MSLAHILLPKLAVLGKLPIPSIDITPPFQVRVAQHKATMKLLDAVALLMPMPEPRTFVGVGSSLSLCRSIAAQGHKRVLLVTDEGLTAIGLYDDIVTQLTDLGVEVRVYDKVEPNPTEEQMVAGMAVGREGGVVDALLAVGGGSPMDAAKVIAAGLTNDMPVSAMEGILAIKDHPLPVYAIPTTAGTGSEATPGAIVTSTSERRKYVVADPRLVTKAAALDPGLMVGLPPAITAATGMDALTHAIEAMVATRVNDDLRTCARAATSGIFSNLRTAVADGSDLAAREAMTLAAFEAGVAIGTTSVGWVHALSHQVSALYQTPHGIANSVLLPGTLRVLRPDIDEPLADLAVAADLATARESVTARATRFIEAVEHLREDVAVPSSLKEIDVADAPLIAQRATDEAFALHAVPRYLRQPELEALIRDVAA